MQANPKSMEHMPIPKLINASQAQAMFQDIPTFNAEKTFKKYFGKKMINRKQLYKIRHPAGFVPIRLRTYKNHCLFSSPMIKSPLMLTTSISVVSNSFYCTFSRNQSDTNSSNPKLSKTALEKHLPHYKYLTSLQVAAEGSNLNVDLFKHIRVLSNLRSLSLIITEDKLEFCYSILTLNHLQKLDLKVLRPSSGSDIQCSQDLVNWFYVKLLDHKDLLFLKLDLKESSAMQNPNFLHFLSKISETAIPSFIVSLTCTSPPEARIEGLRSALDQIDLFTLTLPRNFSTILSCEIISKPQSSPLQAKRVLDLSINDSSAVRPTEIRAAQKAYEQPLLTPSELGDHNAFNLSKMLRVLFDHCYSVAVPLQDVYTLTKLRHIRLDMNHFCAGGFADAMADLAWIFRNSQQTLEELTLWGLTLGDSLGLNQISGDRFNSYMVEKQQLLEEISRLKQLKYLYLACKVNEESMHMITELLASLDNLNTFRLHLNIEMKDWKNTPNLKLLFPKSSKLTILQLELPKITLESLRNLIRAISELDELETLKLSLTPGQAMEVSQDKSYQLILLIKELAVLPRLKQVQIESREYMIRRMHQDSLPKPDVRERAKNEMVGYIEGLFENHSSLERFYCRMPDMYTVEFLR